MSMIKEGATQTLGCLLAMILSTPMLAAWFQHLYTCFTEDRWGFLIAGAIFVPLGIVHGFGIWFDSWH
jgi:hypothetical protein